MNKKRDFPRRIPFGEGDVGAALKFVLGDWLRSMTPKQGLEFRTVTNDKIALHAEIAMKAGLSIIMTASSTAYARLGSDADTLILEMTMTVFERMAHRFNPIEPGHWLAADLSAHENTLHVVIQSNGGVICSVVTLPGEIANPPTDKGHGPSEMSDGQTRFHGLRPRRKKGGRQ